MRLRAAGNYRTRSCGGIVWVARSEARERKVQANDPAQRDGVASVELLASVAEAVGCGADGESPPGSMRAVETWLVSIWVAGNTLPNSSVPPTDSAIASVTGIERIAIAGCGAAPLKPASGTGGVTIG